MVMSNNEYEINKYYKLLDNINELEKRLNDCIENIDDASISLDTYFNINGDNIDNYYFKRSVDKIKYILGVLNKTIKPAIIEKINNYNIEEK